MNDSSRPQRKTYSRPSVTRLPRRSLKNILPFRHMHSARPDPIEAAARLDEREKLRDETAYKAWVDWTIHLHEEIHQYLRLTATLQQIGVTTFVSLIAVAIQFPKVRVLLLLISPYLLGFLIMTFIAYLREVFVCAAFIEHYETELARSTGMQVLVTERVLGASPPNARGSFVADILNLALFLISLTLSVFYSISKGWQIVTLNAILLAILITSVVISGIEMRQARNHVIQAARQFSQAPANGSGAG